MKNNYKVIDISGIGHCGKSIVNSIFANHDEIHVHNPLFEFNLLRFYGGLINLESDLVHNWSPLRAGMAINHFRFLINKISPKAKISSPSSILNSGGWNYNEILNCDLEKITNDYLDSLEDFSTKSVWPYYEIYHNPIKRLFSRLRNKLLNNKKKQKIIFSSGSNFNSLTKKYLEDILFNHSKSIVCTNNMFEPFSPDKYLHFFENPYSIIVWRDPRDIYVSSKLGDKFVPESERKFGVTKYHKSFTLSDDISLFIKRQKLLQSKCIFSNQDRVLNIKFEDIVNNFEKSIDDISKFVQVSIDNIDSLKKKVNVENSKKNIGVWKTYDNQLEIDLISKELNSYMSYFKYE